MKKAGIIILAGLVLIGCIFAAGCTTTGEPVIGVWKLMEPTDVGTQETEGYDAYLTFIFGGIGYQSFYTEGEEYDETESSSTYSSGSSSRSTNFTWVKKNDTTYSLSFPYEDNVTAVYNPKEESLTTDWGVYYQIL